MQSETTILDQEPRRGKIALGVAIGAGVLAAILRIVPHPPNFSGIGALGLFGGARLQTWQAYLLPLVIMALSDFSLWLLTGLDDKYSPLHLSRVYVYASFMIYVAIGRLLIRRNSILMIACAGTLGALQFFVVTNFCEWLFQPFMAVPDVFRYSRDLGGLATCFVAGLGFYQQDPTAHPFMLFTDPRLWLAWGILGDVLFTTVYVLVHARLTQPAVGPVPALDSVPDGAIKVQP